MLYKGTNSPFAKRIPKSISIYKQKSVRRDTTQCKQVRHEGKKPELPVLPVCRPADHKENASYRYGKPPSVLTSLANVASELRSFIVPQAKHKGRSQLEADKSHLKGKDISLRNKSVCTRKHRRSVLSHRNSSVSARKKQEYESLQQFFADFQTKTKHLLKELEKNVIGGP